MKGQMSSFKRKILLLEDDLVLSHTLSKVLSISRYESIMPRSVESLFSSLNKGDITLVVSDLNLPWVNSLDLCRMIKQSAHLKHIPFIFISGTSDEAKVNQAFLHGCDDYLTKPFHIKELKSSIEALIRINPLQHHM